MGRATSVVSPAVLAGALLLLVSACDGGDRATVAATTGPASSEEARPATEATTGTATPATTGATRRSVMPPSDFVARPSQQSVELSWVPHPDSEDVDRFVIYRDGVQVALVSGRATSHTDTRQLKPATSYEYEIEAQEDAARSVRVPAYATTPRARPAAARLSGVFDVRLKVTSQSGYAQLPPGGSAGWRFRPRCDNGPCDVRWADIHGPMRAGLARKGARYEGTASARLIPCGGVLSTSTVTVALRVVKAAFVGGEWRAKRITGKLKHAESAQLGCVAAQATYRVRGRLAD